MKREGAIVRKIMKELKKVPNCFVVKLHGSAMQRSGIPDLLVILDGRHIWFEVKAEKRKATKLQRHTIALLHRAGGEAYVVNCWNNVQRVLEAGDRELVPVYLLEM